MKFTATAKVARARNLGLLVRSIVVPPAARAVGRSVEIVLRRAQELVPVDTGELKASGKTSVEERKGLVVGTVAFTAKHGPYIEWGTGRRGADSPGAGPYPYNPNWPGMAARPFLRPALDSSRQDILNEFKREFGG